MRKVVNLENGQKLLVCLEIFKYLEYFVVTGMLPPFYISQDKRRNGLSELH